MANILHLDPSPVANAAMKGILEKQGHRCVPVATVLEAWSKLYSLIRIDLIFLEPELKTGDGLIFVQQLRADCFFKEIPLVVYSAGGSHESIQRAVGLRIQRYLLKPYDVPTVDHEVAKAVRFPWRDTLFEEERSFCAQMRLMPSTLRQRRESMMTAAQAFKGEIPALMERKDLGAINRRIDPLEENATAAGAWALANLLQELRSAAEEQNWQRWVDATVRVEFAIQLTYSQLNPQFLPAGFWTEEERLEHAAQEERRVWLEAGKNGMPPLTSEAETLSRVGQLAGCPTIDSVVAAFQMTANGTVASLGALMELVSLDPGLCVEMIVAANRLNRAEPDPIDDPRAAVALLGELRLQAAARMTPTVPARRMNFGALNWARYSRFQIGVAEVASFICKAMELSEISSQAFTAGLIQDFGKLLMLRIYPFGWEAALRFSQEKHIEVLEAEQRLMGCNSREMARYFAEKRGLPRLYISVLRWIDQPEEATEDSELVAAVAVARQLCWANHVGESGDRTAPSPRRPIDQTPAGSVLKARIFPGFNWEKFEKEARVFCDQLRPRAA